jgi:hypothetical protein
VTINKTMSYAEQLETLSTNSLVPDSELKMLTALRGFVRELAECGHARKAGA